MIEVFVNLFIRHRGVQWNAPLSLAIIVLAAACIGFSTPDSYGQDYVDVQNGIVDHEEYSFPRIALEKPFGHLAIPTSDSSHSFDVLHYRLDLQFPMISDYYGGSVTVLFRVNEQSLTQIRLHMVQLVADSVFSQGQSAGFSNDDTSIVIDLMGTFHLAETLFVRIFYHDTLDGRGFYHYPRNSYTMAEPQDARWWFPCYDEPWDKATAEIIATVPESFEVGSNGYLAEVLHDETANTKSYHWVSESPIATYLINLIMGEYATWTDYYINGTGDSIPIFNMVWREDSTRAAFDFGTVPEMMRVFSEQFYPYPFEKYGQGTIAPFFAGGMEHQTMTSLNRSWITGDRRVELGYAHELAHMWWGDFVTLADWRHIWLNEGFATYASALFNESAHGLKAFRRHMFDYQHIYYLYQESAGPHPIFDPPDLFGVNVYVKGAWVLHMLRGIMGDEKFFRGLHLYAESYAYGNASTNDFRDSMEQASGLDLNWFFDQWVYGQGFPIYHYAWDWWADGDFYMVRLDIEQAQTDAQLFSMPISIGIVAGDTSKYVVQNDQWAQRFEFTVDAAPTELLFDPDNWVMDSSIVVDEIDVPDSPPLPLDVSIENIYPNPFNNSTNIQFTIAGESQNIVLSVYNIEGRQARILRAGRMAPARYSVSWDGADGSGHLVSSGIYLIRLAGETRASLRKVIYIK